MSAHHVERLIGATMLTVALISGVVWLWIKAEAYLDRRIAELDALMQSAADAFDDHWDDIAVMIDEAPSPRLSGYRQEQR